MRVVLESKDGLRYSQPRGWETSSTSICVSVNIRLARTVPDLTTVRGSTGADAEIVFRARKRWIMRPPKGREKTGREMRTDRMVGPLVQRVKRYLE